MELRDALESDSGRLTELTDAPSDVIRNLIHDRTVRVAERDGVIEGFVSFDAEARTVHVTQLDGDPGVFEDLLAEPVRFAAAEDMAVEVLVPQGEEAVAEAVEAVEFQQAGAGPRFDGQPTTRYRIEEP